MKYTKKERLDIGKRVYDGEINKYQAVAEYDIVALLWISHVRILK